MDVIGRRTKMRRGESAVIRFDIFNDHDKTDIYKIPTNVLNPYIVVTVKSNYYHNDDFYRLNIWRPVTGGEEARFDIALPSYITHEWIEQQYRLSISVIGGVSTIERMQGMVSSLYNGDWRFEDDSFEMPSDYETLYEMIEYKDKNLIKDLTNAPICNISYNEPLAIDRLVLIDD